MRIAIAALLLTVAALVGLDFPQARVALAPAFQPVSVPAAEPRAEPAPAAPFAESTKDAQPSARDLAVVADPAPGDDRTVASRQTSQDQTPLAQAPFEDEATCTRPPSSPLPRPGSPAAQSFWDSFRAPLPATALWNPPGTRHVGLQAGHWLTEEVPDELRGLQQGTSGGGKAEWEVTLDIAQRAAEMLEQAGVKADVLPATVPVSYRAHAFLSIHADGDNSGSLYGFKVARPGFSSVPEYDDRLVDALNAAYGAETGMLRDDEHISRRMTYYYAFNSRRYCHAVAAGVPQAIVETGFLTSAIDRRVLIGDPDASARGIAAGVLSFLSRLP